jgi:hypothetical protein
VEKRPSAWDTHRWLEPEFQSIEGLAHVLKASRCYGRSTSNSTEIFLWLKPSHYSPQSRCILHQRVWKMGASDRDRKPWRSLSIRDVSAGGPVRDLSTIGSGSEIYCSLNAWQACSSPSRMHRHNIQRRRSSKKKKKKTRAESKPGNGSSTCSFPNGRDSSERTKKSNARRI